MFLKNKLSILCLLYFLHITNVKGSDLLVIHNPAMVVTGVYFAYKIYQSYYNTKDTYQKIINGNENNSNKDGECEEAIKIFLDKHQGSIKKNQSTGDSSLKEYIQVIHNDDDTRDEFDKLMKSKTESVKNIAIETIVFGQAPLWNLFMKFIGMDYIPETIGKNLLEYNEGGLKKARENLKSCGGFIALCFMCPWLIMLTNPGLFFGYIVVDVLKSNKGFTISEKYCHGILGRLLNIYKPTQAIKK